MWIIYRNKYTSDHQTHGIYSLPFSKPLLKELKTFTTLLLLTIVTISRLDAILLTDTSPATVLFPDATMRKKTVVDVVFHRMNSAIATLSSKRNAPV